MEKKELIVLIDDDSDILSSFKVILKAKGFEVVTFKNFDEPLPFLKNNVPDLIISDLNVNGSINGVDFFVQQIMGKNLKFALHTGSFDPMERDTTLFKKGLPNQLKIVKAPSTQDEQLLLQVVSGTGEVKASFPCFCKPTLPNSILFFFGMK
jgi:response regulator RpfG family c-di-GMP phosphodiesterase